MRNIYKLFLLLALTIWASGAHAQNSICAGSAVPQNWVVYGTQSNTLTCGGSIQSNNVWLIENSVGATALTICANTPVPAGWVVVATSTAATTCIPSSTGAILPPNNNLWQIQSVAGRSSMTVCSGAAPLPAGWAVQSTSTSPVACLPETNNPIYNLNNNVEVIVGPALPKTPLPTINVTITPQQLIAGQPFTETWSTANATSMTRYCSGSVPGLSGTTTLPVNGSVTATASAAWAGTSVVCNFTAIGPGGSLDVAPTVTTVAATPAPTINLTLSPNPMVAGQPYSETFGATNATSLTYNCTSTGTGWTANTQSVAPNSSYSSTASAAWVGYPTNCLWTATGPGGTTTYSNTYTTVNPPPKPTINLTLSPNPMVAGKPYSETFGATNATSLTFNCTSTGTGWTANNQPVTPNSSFSNTASASWVGYPTNCVWTATGPGGTTTYSNTYVTVNN